MTPRTCSLSAIEIAQLLGQQYPPTEEQRAIIEAPLAPLLVVAGAGSGKTETMSARVVWLIANGHVDPREILGLTFTRKAAHELNERIGIRLGQLATAMRDNGLALPPGLESTRTDIVGQRPHVHTYNGFALDLVKEHALRIGVDPEFTVLTPAAAWQLAYDIVDGYRGTLPFTQKSATIASAVVSLSGSLADHLVGIHDFDSYLRDIEVTTMNLPLQDEGGKRRSSPKEVRELWERLEQRRALVPLLKAFAERKREIGAIDFADQVAYAAAIARDAPAVVDSLRAQYPVVLLDEFQDTSVGQLVFLEQLFGHGHATCAVGDPNQAIYGWRGASAASLSQFVLGFGTASTPVREYSLSTSFRNDAQILTAANAIGERLQVPDSPVSLPVLQPRPGAGPGKVTCTCYPDMHAEADGIAAWITRERDNTRELDGLEDAPMRTAAVLVRTRSYIPTLVDALENAGLTVQVVGGGGLLHEPEVADVRALLEVADASDRGDSLMRLLEGSRFRVGTRDIAVLGRWRDHLQRRNPEARERGDAAALVTLADALEQLPPEGWRDPEGRVLSTEGRARLADVCECLRTVRAHAALALPDMVSLAIRTLGTDIALLSDPHRDRARALANLDEFRAHAASYAATAQSPGLSAFLAFLDVTAEKEAGLAAVDDLQVSEDAVTISTMHAAKGLEWDLVAIAGLADGSFPSYARASARERNEQGELRPKDPGWLSAVALASIPTELRGDSDILHELRWAEASTQVQLVDLLDEFRLANGEEKLREETRLMYVAVTRAKAALHLSWAPWREGSGTPSSQSRFLTALERLPDIDHGSVGIVPEDNPLMSVPRRAEWPLPPGARERVTSEAIAQVEAVKVRGTTSHVVSSSMEQFEAATDHVIAIHRAGRATRDVHLPLRLSPSDLVALAEDGDERLKDIVRPMPRRPSAHATLGTRFHTWLETVSTAPALIDVDEIDSLGGEADDGEDAAASIAELREKFSRSRFASMAPISVEQPVSLVLSGAYMPGVIDAVYASPEDPDDVWIVDWKTGRVPHGADLERKGLQLSVYRLAWHQRTGTPLGKIRTFFHYVAAERTIEIKHHASAVDLERLLGAINDS